MLNKVTLIGRLGQDPEVRYAANGNAVCTLSVATSEKWTDKNTNERKEKTEWHRVVVWGKSAEHCGQYLAKGSMVCIEGKIETRKWQDREGNDKYTTEIKANMFGGVIFLSQPNQAAGTDRAPPAVSDTRPATTSAAAVQKPSGFDSVGDEIPF